MISVEKTINKLVQWDISLQTYVVTSVGLSVEAVNSVGDAEEIVILLEKALEILDTITLNNM